MSLEKHADPSPPDNREQTRTWTVYVLFLATVVAIFSVSAIVVLLGYFIEFGNLKGIGEDSEATIRYATQPHILILSLTATCLTMLACAGTGATLSRSPWRLRLGLQAPELSASQLIVAMLGAPALGMLLETIVLGLGIEVSGTLKQISDAVLSAEGLEIPFLVLAISLGPAMGEEFVFRGFIQRRLVQRHGALWGIVAAAILFGIMHFDPLQSPLAALLGIYIGYLAYRFRSIWPAVLTHAFNNFFSISTLLIFPPQQPEPKAQYLPGLLAGLFFLFCLWYLSAQRSALRPRALQQEYSKSA